MWAKPKICTMKTIKFETADERQRQFAAAVRKNVNDYFKSKGISTKGNFSLFIQTATMLAIYLAPFVLMLTVQLKPWVALFMTVIMGIGLAGIGMCVMHDGVHGSFSTKEWVNKMTGATLYLLGAYVLNWKIQHNVLHHTYTNIDGYDQDIASRGPIRFSQHASLKKIHRYQYIYAFFFYGFTSLSKVIKDFTQLIEYKREGLMRHNRIPPTLEYLKMLIIKSIYLFVFIGLPLLFTNFSWWQVALGFLLMHWSAGVILSVVFQMAHVVEGALQPIPNKDGIVASDWAVHQLHSTSDFARNNLFLNWYIGGLNFQIEHHLFPNISHVHYRKIAPIVESTAKEFGFFYNLKPSFLAAFKSHVKRLKELGIQASPQVDLA